MTRGWQSCGAELLVLVQNFRFRSSSQSQQSRGTTGAMLLVMFCMSWPAEQSSQTLLCSILAPGVDRRSPPPRTICCTSCGERIFMHHTLFTNSLEKTWGPTMITLNESSDQINVYTQKEVLHAYTATGRRRREEYHFPGRRIQAASLILQGPPVGLQDQITARARYVTRSSC